MQRISGVITSMLVCSQLWSLYSLNMCAPQKTLNAQHPRRNLRQNSANQLTASGDSRKGDTRQLCYKIPWLLLGFVLHACQPLVPSAVGLQLAGVLGQAELAFHRSQEQGQKPWEPAALALHSQGLYLSDASNHRILNLQSGGTLQVYAGDGEKGLRNGQWSQARFSRPTGLVLDAQGNLFVADTDNHLIRKISNQGEVSTFAGTGQAGLHDGPARRAQFDHPIGLTLADDGRLWVADVGNHRIRQIDSVGQVTTVMGQQGELSSPMAVHWQGARLVIASLEGLWEWQPERTAKLRLPAGPVGRLGQIQALPDGSVWASEVYRHQIIRISPTNQIQVMAGKGYSGFADGLADQAQLSFPWGLARLNENQWAIADTGNRRIRKWVLTPTTTKLETWVKIGDFGFEDTVREPLKLGRPEALHFWNGQLVVADYTHNRLLTIGSTGQVSKLGATHSEKGHFDKPAGLTSDQDNLYIAESARHRIRVLQTNGQIRVLAGQLRGYLDDKAEQARFNLPTALVRDAHGNLFVTDTGNHCIRKITPAGDVSTLAGAGTPGFKDDTGTKAQFYFPVGLAWSAAGDLLVADFFNHRIRQVTVAGVVSTWAGTGRGGLKEGPRLQAEFYAPQGIAVDDQGQVYVADSWNHRIRYITPAGQVHTLIGPVSPLIGLGLGDGPGTQGILYEPKALTVGPDGFLYMADAGHERVQKIARP